MLCLWRVARKARQASRLKCEWPRTGRLQIEGPAALDDFLGVYLDDRFVIHLWLNKLFVFELEFLDVFEFLDLRFQVFPPLVIGSIAEQIRRSAPRTRSRRHRSQGDSEEQTLSQSPAAASEWYTKLPSIALKARSTGVAPPSATHTKA